MEFKKMLIDLKKYTLLVNISSDLKIFQGISKHFTGF